MRTSTAALLVLLAFPAAPSLAAEPVAAPASVPLPPELDRVLREYEKAWGARDPAALAELFAEDGFVLASGKPPVRGRAAIRSAYAGHGGALSLRALAFSTSGDVGWIVGAYSPRAGEPDSGKFVLALTRDARGRWRIAADMDNGNQERRGPPGS